MSIERALPRLKEAAWRAGPRPVKAGTHLQVPLVPNSLFTLVDDIASLLDDIATMTKLATKKTAGVLGDDLALNAEQVTGVATQRELPVVLAVARGSMVNKAILVPAALALSFFLPFAIVPLLMAGGAFLCFEGVEKLIHSRREAPRPGEAAVEAAQAVAAHSKQGLLALEKDKIRGAVRTDFVLSAEIIVISLGSVAGRPFMVQLGTLVAISAVMTVGVYGLVAAIVKLDDLGLLLEQKDGTVLRQCGRGIVAGAPWLMKLLSWAGTAAMFLVGGGIVAHGVPPFHRAIEHLDSLPLGFLLTAGAQGLVGLLTGGVLVALFAVFQRTRKRPVRPT